MISEYHIAYVITNQRLTKRPLSLPTKGYMPIRAHSQVDAERHVRHALRAFEFYIEPQLTVVY